MAGVFLCLIPWLIAAPVGAATDITVELTASADTVKAGETFTYTIRATNATSYQVTIDISDEVPAGAMVVNPGTGTLSNGVIRWNSRPATPGQTIDVSFAVVVNQAGTIVNNNYHATSGITVDGLPASTVVVPNDPANITISANPNPVTVGGSAELVITVTDAYDNPVADGTNVTINFDKGTIEGYPAGIPFDVATSGGQIIKTLVAGTETGTAHLVVTVGSIQKTTDVTFTSGPPFALTVSASPGSIPANGSNTASINVEVHDSYGNPVAQTPVTLTTSLGQLNGSGTTVVINTSNGQATATLGGTVAGTARLTVTAGSLIDTSQSVYLAPGPPTRLLLQANPSSLTANGTSTSTITLLVWDQNNNRVDTSVPVILTTSLGALNGSGATYTETTTDGEVQVLLTSGMQAGIATISASASGLGTTLPVDFVPGPPSFVDLYVDPTTIPGDGASTTALTAIVRDANGNPVNTPVSVTFAAGVGTILPDNGGNTSNGVITRTLRSSTSLGTVPVTATATGIATPATHNVEFTVGSPHTAEVTLVPTSPITVGTPAALALTIRDSVGHVVPGAAITVTSGLGSISPAPTGTTDVNGQLLRTLVSTRTGADTLGVLSAVGVLNVIGGSLSFKPDVPVQAALTANPTQLFANGSTTAVVTATLKDQYGNLVPGVAPSFTTSLGTLTGSSQTNAAGVVTHTLQSSTTLGTAVVSISGLLTVTDASVDFVTGPPALVVMEAQPTQATANGSDSVTMVITTTDSIGHPIVGQTLAVTSSIGIVSGSEATDAQGKLTRYLTSTQSGQPQIYVAGILVTSSSITFVSGPLNKIKVTPSGSPSEPLPVSAGIPVTFTATGYDLYDNPITGLTFAWSAISLEGNGIISANGIFTGTSMGVSPNRIMIRATVDSTIGSSTVKIGPGAAAQATVDAEPTTLPANDTSISTLTFYVKDVYGNAVLPNLPLTVTSSIGTVEGTSTTILGGIAYRTIRSRQAGTATINVTNLITVTGERVITFTPGAPSRVVVSASPSSLPANGVATTTLTLTLQDFYGNPVGPSYLPVIQVSSGTISGSGTTNANGVVTRTLTAPLTAGTAVLTVKYASLPLLVSGDEVLYTVGALHHVTISPDGFLNVTAGQPMTFTAQAYDRYNAPIPDDVSYVWFRESYGTGSGDQNTYDGPQVVFTGKNAGSGVKLNVYAEKGTSTESFVNITVLPGPPVGGMMMVEPALITADGVSPLTFTLAYLVDNYGNTSGNGTVVTVTVQSAPVARTKSGVANSGEVVVATTATTQAGTYPISATTAAGPLALTGVNEVTFGPGSPALAQVISASPTEIVADEASTSTIALQLRDLFGNKVASGLTPVVSATLGTLLPDSNPTDENGVLTRTLKAGLTLGDAQLYVAGFAASGLTVPFIPGPPVSATITVITSILAAGGQSTPVTFDVRDAWDHAVADGTVITPTLTPAYGTWNGSRQTVGGLVQQTLTPATVVGTATVGSADLTVSGDTLITFEPGPAALARLTASPPLLKVGQTTAVTLTVTDAYSNIVPPTLITTTALLGDFEGSGPTFSQTTSSGTGMIMATLSSTTAGTETVTLNGPDGLVSVHPASDVIFFMPEEALTVTLNPTGTITATAGVTLTVTASSRDKYANTVDPWTPVNYTWWQSATTDGPGYGLLIAVDVHTRTLNFKPIKVGPNRLWATGGITTSTLLTVNVVPGPPARVTVALNPTSVLADGVSTYRITLTNVTDVAGNAIPDGIPLTVTIQSIPAVVAVGTTSNGAMTGILPSSTHAGIHPLAVTGSGGPLTLNGATTMTFTPGPPARAFVKATPEVLPADGISTAALVITVRDEHFNLVADGTPITVTASAGSISGSESMVNGQINRTLHAPVALGTANFWVESSGGPLDVSGDTVEFVPGPPAQAFVTAAPAKILADSISTSNLVITIKDSSGFTVPGSGTALLSAVRGSLAPTTAVASSGSLTTTFTAANSVGPAGLVVIYDGTPLEVVGDPELIPGLPVSATLSANPTHLDVGSSQHSDLTINLIDLWGHPVADGTVVTVTTSLGSILPNTSGSSGGAVTRVLTPGLTMGTAAFTVTTSSGNLSPAGDKVTITAGNLEKIELSPTGTVQIAAGKPITFTAKGYDTFGNETGTGLFTWTLRLSSGNGALSNGGVFTGTTVGRVGVQAVQGTVFSPIKDVIVIPGSPITALVSASPITISVGGVTSTLTLTARDAFGNLVADGTALNVTTDLGAITGSSTVQNGVLTRTLTSGNYYGVVNVIVNGFEAGGDKVKIAARSRLTANPSSLIADGFSQTTLTIEMCDALGAPVADGTKPKVEATSGELEEDCQKGNKATVGGQLICTLQAALTPRVAQIYVDNFLIEGSVSFVLGPASVARISASLPWLMADSANWTTLTIKVEDAYGHALTSTSPLTVTSSLGTISGFAPTVNGVTTRVLTASAQSGAAIISVAGLTTVGDVKVHFVGTSLHDGSFENGGLNNWSVGQVAPVGSSLAYSATVLSSDRVGNILVTPPSGSKMMRLGATTTDNTDHSLSEIWLSQPVYVPSLAPDEMMQITFRYRVLAYELSRGYDPANEPYSEAKKCRGKEWDPFSGYLNGNKVWKDYEFDELQRCFSPIWWKWYLNLAPSSDPKDTGWHLGNLITSDSADIKNYTGRVVTLKFHLPNGQQGIDNTWVYLDDIKLTRRQVESYEIFLPMVRR